MSPSNFQAKKPKPDVAERETIEVEVPDFEREEVYVFPTLNMDYKDNSLKVSRIVLTPELVAVAIYQARGYLSVVARKLGTTVRVVQRFVKDFDVCRIAAEEADAMILDFTEAKLIQKIKAGDTASIIFMLRTRGKDRGYTEKQLAEAENSEKMREEAKRDAEDREREIRENLALIGDRLSDAMDIEISFESEEGHDQSDSEPSGA